MKAEQVLSVLMDDKKYKARVEELKTLEAKLSEVRQIAATLDKAKQVEEAAKVREQDLMHRQAELEEMVRIRVQQINDELKQKALDLDERAAKEREQYKDVRNMLEEALKTKDEVMKKQIAYVQQVEILKKWEAELFIRERTLADKVKKVNEAFNG